MSFTASGSAARLDIGQTLQDVLRVLLRNLGALALLGFLLAGAPVAAVYASIALGAQHPIFILLGLLGLAISFVTRPILYGAVIFRTARRLDGEPAPLGECLAAGRRRWGTMLGLTIWSGLLIGLGYVFLVVPGIYLAVQWAVAGPVVVLRGRGISDSMDESARLTKGRRWAVLLFYLIVLIGLFVASLLLVIVESGLALLGSRLLNFVLENALNIVLVDVSFPLVAAVLYRRLRGDAEGPPTAVLAEVFA